MGTQVISALRVQELTNSPNFPDNYPGKLPILPGEISDFLEKPASTVGKPGQPKESAPILLDFRFSMIRTGNDALSLVVAAMPR